MSALPPLPERVRLYPFHRPFALLTAEGLKDETRGRPGAPGWIAVYEALRVRRLSPEALAAVAALGLPPERVASWSDHDRPPAVIGMAHVARSRLLRREDVPRTFFFEEGRYCWEIDVAARFSRALSLRELGVQTPPQGYVLVPGVAFARALEGAEVRRAPCRLCWEPLDGAPSLLCAASNHPMWTAPPGHPLAPRRRV